MARLSIYVPDEKKPQIDRYKSVLNLSQVFMDAFNLAVRRLSETQTLKGTHMQAIIERLRKQYVSDYEKGWKEGVHIANTQASHTLRVGDFQSIAEGATAFSRSRRCQQWLIDQFSGPDPKDTEMDEHSLYADIREKTEYEGIDIETYLDGVDAGFSEQVKAIWAQIKNQVLGDPE